MSRSNSVVRFLAALPVAAVLAGSAVACQEGVSSADRGPRLELVSRDSQTIQVGELLTPVVRATYGGRPLSSIEINWASDGNASVDERTHTDAQGHATAQWYLGTRPGVYHVVATGAGPQPLRVTAIAIPGAFKSLRLRPDSGVLASVADSIQLAAIGSDRFGNAVSTPEVSWWSLDPTVAVVGPAGLVRGRSGGSARVVATAAGAADTAIIRVQQHPATLRITTRSETIEWLKGTAQLAVEVRDIYGNVIPRPSVTWTSLNPTIVQVNASSGLATAVAGGSARVVAQAELATDTVVVTVHQVVVGITISPLFPQMMVGDSLRLVPKAYDRLNSVVPSWIQAWWSDDESIATVSETGMVHALAAGEVKIFVGSGSAFAISTVTVVPRTP